MNPNEFFDLLNECIKESSKDDKERFSTLAKDFYDQHFKKKETISNFGCFTAAIIGLFTITVAHTLNDIGQSAKNN